MTVADVLGRARALVAESKCDVLGALESAAGGNPGLVADALEALDSMTPHPWTFLLWADGAAWAIEGDSMGVIYLYDRKRTEVLALLGRATQRASRSESAA